MRFIVNKFSSDYHATCCKLGFFDNLERAEGESRVRANLINPEIINNDDMIISVTQVLSMQAQSTLNSDKHLRNRFVILTNDKLMTQRANLKGVNCINLHDLNSHLRHTGNLTWTSSLLLSCTLTSISLTSSQEQEVPSIMLKKKKSVYDSLQDGITLLEKLKVYSNMLSSIKKRLPQPNEKLNEGCEIEILNDIQKHIDNFKEDQQESIDETIDIFNDHLKVARRNTRLKKIK